MNCTARHIPHTCPTGCARALLVMCATRHDRGEREPIPTNSADLVLTPEQWRTKYGRCAA